MASKTAGFFPTPAQRTRLSRSFFPSIKSFLSNRFELLRAREQVHDARNMPPCAARCRDLPLVQRQRDCADGPGAFGLDGSKDGEQAARMLVGSRLCSGPTDDPSIQEIGRMASRSSWCSSARSNGACYENLPSIKRESRAASSVCARASIRLRTEGLASVTAELNAVRPEQEAA